MDSALKEQILYFGNGTEPKDLDPHTVTGVPESHILMALLEGLVMRHPEGLDPLPDKGGVNYDAYTGLYDNRGKVTYVRSKISL